MTNVLVQLDFPHDFSAEVLGPSPSGLGSGERVVRVPVAPEEVESIYVRFAPSAEAWKSKSSQAISLDPRSSTLEGFEPWTGAFARGFASDDMASGVYGWPDGKSVAVVSAGYGYVVNVAARTWVRLEPMPITDVRVMVERKLIVFADFTNLFAYNGERNVWKSERLSWDGVTITQTGTDHLFGIGWDAMQDKEVDFVVDARDGTHTGGARPWAKK